MPVSDSICFSMMPVSDSISNSIVRDVFLNDAASAISERPFLVADSENLLARDVVRRSLAVRSHNMETHTYARTGIRTCTRTHAHTHAHIRTHTGADLGP